MSLMSKKMVNGAVALGCMLFAAPVLPPVMRKEM